ncbi:uncharacterized protein LOC120351092 [Nilaparvata lugens]|uniref:uncharacterized protein LOC120351092 n=1 Tax=Nilaparvata lugens TaxID=108931 RepID=UPI00193E4CEB|nr:uncharacterized protein LOC120351092 [Nilaparvata lugens]
MAAEDFVSCASGEEIGECLDSTLNDQFLNGVAESSLQSKSLLDLEPGGFIILNTVEMNTEINNDGGENRYREKRKKNGIRPGDNDKWSIAKQLMEIALLPPSRAQEATDVLSLIYQTGKSRVLIDYFRKQWLGKVTPESFSVSKEPSGTNNAQESLNRCLNRLIKAQGNPGIFGQGYKLSLSEINYFRNMSKGREGTHTLRTKCLL